MTVDQSTNDTPEYRDEGTGIIAAVAAVVIWFAILPGCVGFMISALFAFVLPGPPNIEAVTLSIAFTLSGAVCFLVGSLLMLPEEISQGDV